MRAPGGTVYLVGAGPGDPELITVLGLRRLRVADVVVYDRLVAPQLVEEAPASAERVFAGKGPGFALLRQRQITALLIERARAGSIVVRLKGGDPFVFGRGGEEVQALRRAGIACEVVPGVSSALGVPAHAGIPLTHRGVASSFAVLTAQRAAARSPGQKLGSDSAPLSGLADVDTLVVLMGVRRLAEVVAALARDGRSPCTPVALIENGTLPEQRVVIGSLSDIVERARAARVAAPATIVVGEVVRLRETFGLTQDGTAAVGRRAGSAEAPVAPAAIEEYQL